MGQRFSHCDMGTEPSLGDFEPHLNERRRRRLPGVAPKSLPILKTDDSTALSRATDSTALSSSKASSSPPSPLGSSSTTVTGNPNQIIRDSFHHNTNHIHQHQALRYTTSTRNLQCPNKEATATTTTATIPSFRSRVDSDPTSMLLRRQHQAIHGLHQYNPNRQNGRQSAADKRSNPVKLPRKRHTYTCTRNSDEYRNSSAHPHASARSHEDEPPQDASYLERMYDSRTWEMYRRITSHREKVEAFNAANAAAKGQRNESDDDRNSTGKTYMSDPVQRVTNSSTMVGGVDYDNFCDLHVDDDDDSRNGGAGVFLEDHSAPPYHHHRQCDNGQHHHQPKLGYNHYHPSGQQHLPKNNSNTETYSEWEHMNGDDMEATSSNPSNAHGGQHETIFLFDF